MKKRYQLTLDDEVVAEFKQALLDMGLPANTFSAIVLDMLRGTLPIYQKMAEQKKHGEQLSLDAVFQGVAQSFKQLLKE